MIPHDVGRMRQSVTRYKTIESRIGSAAPYVNKETIRGMLSEPMPEGVCVHHYSDGLGTLWSMIFDVTDATVEICFGAPSSERNSWRSFGLQDPIGVTEYKAHLSDEPAAPDIWRRLPPGKDE